MFKKQASAMSLRLSEIKAENNRVINAVTPPKQLEMRTLYTMQPKINNPNL
jgi:hypothetical protein